MHPGQNTYCHHCRRELIRRVGFHVTANRIESGKCPQCGSAIPGVWSNQQALGFKPKPQADDQQAAPRRS